MLKAVLKEYGLSWAFNRTMYAFKLKLLSHCSTAEKLFEKKIPTVKRVDVFDIDISDIREFISHLPDDKKTELILQADDACNGIIRAFSSMRFDYGFPVDWQLNPLTNKRCSEKDKWYRIPDFDKNRGDIKAIWEASRFSHFVLLARAYLLTADEAYYRAFSLQLADWLQKNPYSYGANYKCGQECALRMVNGLLAYTIFARCNVATDSDHSNIRQLIARCYKKILSNFFYAHKCIKNNHTISELLGMIVGAWCCDDEKQLNKAYQILNNTINEQFFDDGGYVQYSFNYQRLALQDLECILNLTSKTGHRLSQENEDKLLKSVLLMYQCQDSSGDLPNYGSNDGALVFPLNSCGYRDFRPIISSVYRLLTNKRLYEPGLYDEEYLWFRGKNAVEQEFSTIKRESSQFWNAGLFTIRDEKVFMMLVLNKYLSRPAHMDQLHMDLWIDGTNVLCDSGTYSYADELGKAMAHTEGHNTVVIDGVQQMNTYGAFMVYDRTERSNLKCDQNSFSGQMISRNGYSHHRIVSKNGNSFSIIDTLSAPEGKKAELFFHTPCDVCIKDGNALLSHDGCVVCTIKSNMIPEVENGGRSLFYLKLDDCKVLKFKGTASDNKQNKIIWKTKIIIGANTK